MADDNLCKLAEKVSRNAYAPYSCLEVGAAVDTDAGIFSGCNLENASYGLTTCAERNAVAAAVASGAQRVNKIAVYSKQKLVTPCGACLQVIREFATAETEIILCSKGKRKKVALGDLLPLPFRL